MAIGNNNNLLITFKNGAHYLQEFIHANSSLKVYYMSTNSFLHNLPFQSLFCTKQ